MVVITVAPVNDQLGNKFFRVSPLDHFNRGPYSGLTQPGLTQPGLTQPDLAQSAPPQ